MSDTSKKLTEAILKKAGLDSAMSTGAPASLQASKKRKRGSLTMNIDMDDGRVVTVRPNLWGTIDPEFSHPFVDQFVLDNKDVWECVVKRNQHISLEQLESFRKPFFIKRYESHKRDPSFEKNLEHADFRRIIDQIDEAIAYEMCRYLQPTNCSNNVLYHFFENIVRSGLQEEFEGLIEDCTKSYFPPVLRMQYIGWVRSFEYGAFKDKAFERIAKQFPEDLMAIQPGEGYLEVKCDDLFVKRATPSVQKIIVDGDLVDLGKASDDILPQGAHDEEGVQERKVVPHIDWLAEAISKHFHLVDGIKVYYPKLPEGKTEDNDYSFRIMAFSTRDDEGGPETLHQIAVNNWYGCGTYVIKEPVDIDIRAPELVEISDLLHSGKAWPVRCMNQEQYVRQVIEICKAHQEDLRPYISRMSWRDKKQDLMDSVYGYVVATGQWPKTSNKHVIGFGPLRGRSTWSRAAASLNSIKGLEEIQGFHGLVEYMKDNGYPDIGDHIDKPSISAVRLYNDAAKVITETGVVPQDTMLDDTTELCGRAGNLISGFFARSVNGGVRDVEKIIPDLHSRGWPLSFDDFMVASGLAVRDESSKLLPANLNTEELPQKRIA